MSTNRVTVRLDVKDEATKIFKQFSGTVDGVSSRLDSMGSKGKSAFSGMSGSIASGIIQAQVLTRTIGLITSAVGSLGDAFKGAIESQSTMIRQAGMLAKAYSISNPAATSFIQGETAKFAGEISALPGNDQQFIDSFQSSLGILAKQGFSQQDSVNNSKELSKLGTLSGLKSDELTDLVRGSKSLEELLELEGFSKNPAIIEELKKLEVQTGQSWQTMTDSKAKTLAILKGLNNTLDPETVKALSSSPQALFESLNSMLFSQYNGIFLGIEKDLDSKAPGIQSVYSAFGDTLNALLGPDGLLSAFTTLGSDLGIDPYALMKGLRSSFLWLKDTIHGITSSIKLDGIPDLSKMNLGGMVGDFLGSIWGGVKNLLQGSGSSLSGIFNSLLSGAFDIFSDIDWNALGQDAGAILGTLFNQANTFIAGVDWSAVGAFAIKLVGGAFQFAGGLIGSFIYNFDWLGPVRSFVSLFGGLWNTIGEALGIGFGYLGKLLQDNFSLVGDSAGAFFNSIGNWLRDMISKIPVVGDDLANAISPSASPPLNTASRFNGFIPNAADGMIGGLLRAAVREGSRMPSGASVVVANSSEAILTRSQQASLARTLSAPQTRSGASLSIGSLVINSAAQDAKGIAQDVMKEIAVEFQKFSNNQLSVMA
jgi:hypothetical protein